MAGTKSKSSTKAGLPLLGKYELGHLLDRGNFTKVYHARCLTGGDPVAVKALDKPELATTGMAARLLREVSAMRRLSHPNTLRLHEVLATRSKVYLVMELAPCWDLLSGLASLPSRRLPEHAARRIFLQLASVLIYSHARGVFHRDVKPQNVLLDADERRQPQGVRLRSGHASGLAPRRRSAAHGVWHPSVRGARGAPP
jgi:serine/threonine protein kinase